MKHLWECEHSYYCSTQTYNISEEPLRYKSFADFLNEEGDADFDMNLVFRWDWSEEEIPFTGDDHYRNGELFIFWMGQRKGLFRCTIVEVCRADEPAVREFLEPRLKHLTSLWEPLALTE